MRIRVKNFSHDTSRKRELFAKKMEKKMARRIFIIGGLQTLVMGGIIAQMRRLQLKEKDRFLLLAEENRINTRLIVPERGMIYDRTGLILAGNEQTYRAVIRREETEDIDQTLARFVHLLGLDGEVKEALKGEVMRHNAFVPVTLADNLDWEEFSKIAVNAPALPGISSEVGASRNYPFGTDSAHFLGYVGPVSASDLSERREPDPLLQIPRFQIGKLNVEARRENMLRGRAGVRHVEVNVFGREMRELERERPVNGDPFQLTIDARLQNYVQARIKDLNAACIVIDVENGGILAIGSDPSYDPNKFVRGISSRDYNALLRHPRRPLFNKAIQGLYPPGSVFKIVTLLAALEAGKISVDEEILCEGFIESNNRKFHCWKGAGHGQLGLIEAFSQSCDVYYYTLAERVGIAKLSEMARRLGLGDRFELPLSSVARGLVPTKKWKRRTQGEAWFVGDTYNAGIGQGYVLSSALQLAVLIGRVASGREIFPYLIERHNLQAPHRTPPKPLDINPAHLALVRRGLFEAVNGRLGTARESKTLGDAYLMAGKTGTSQVRIISARERARGILKHEDLPFEKRDHSLFVGYAPYRKPRYGVAIIGEHGGNGSRFAAPIARDILVRVISGKMPPLNAYPEDQREIIRQDQERLKLRKIAPIKKQRSTQT